MAELYPLSLDLTGRPCLVVGGGSVAERKVRGLLAAGARVTLVAPETTQELASLAARGELCWLARPFAAEDLEGAGLVFVATSVPEVNRLATEEARARGAWVNAAEDGRECDFHVPAVLRRGAVTVAVSTAGASPALAVWVRDHVDRTLSPGVERAAPVMEVLRECAPKGPLKAGEALRGLLDTGVVDDLALDEWAAADEKVARFFVSAPPVREILACSRTEKP